MHTLRLHFRGRRCTYRAPQNWNQLSAAQLIRWAAVAFGPYTKDQQLRLALLIAYGFELKVFCCLKDHYQAQISHTVRFLFGQSQLSSWLLPILRCRYRHYYGPSDHLSNVSAHEFFNYTEVLYRQYREKPSADALTALCAVLYRRKRRNGIEDDLRQPLTDAGISLRIRRFEKLPLAIRQAILLNYEGCRWYLIGRFPEVFEGKTGGKVKPAATDLVLALSGPQLGTYGEAKHVNLYKFLEHTTRLLQLAEDKPL